MVRETSLVPSDLIQGMFVTDGENRREPIPSLPGMARLSVDLLVEECKRIRELGIPAIALFPMTPQERKTPDGSEAWNQDNLVCRACRALKRTVPDLGIVGDVALDPYTSHGQDGVLIDGQIVNDLTLESLKLQAVAQAAAGCDVIAPSDMMDGRIGIIRAALDAEGLSQTMILSYAAKYASGFYGPFRDAIGSSSALGKADKKTYQMDPANIVEALRETALDIAEGADMVMVKPALPYLDIIQTVKTSFGLPTIAYHVSGEYAMVKAAAERGWIDGDAAMLESITAIKRAGADAIITYAASDIARWLRG
ncbi:porphobilinogen synthase [Arboricoccus pini]|uniref:Delta-aminolevulinic acid dehydratase n=2 Tax=Arboricoccus pini TaxID=1963835 RepID=A0A212QSE2_9PROT|nr:porphobilinogen synthase [Arboricoccus pini]